MIRIMVKIIKKKIISLTMICKILLKFDKKKKSRTIKEQGKC